MHWLAIAGTALVCLGIFCLVPAPHPQASPLPSVAPLSQQQIRHATKAQAARLDSIKHELQKLPALTQARDSALMAARRQNARAEHLLTLLHNEATSVTAAVRAQPTERLARALATYRPGTYALDSAHAIR